MKGADVADKKTETAFQPSLSWRACVALIAAVTTLALDYVTKVFVKNTLMVTGENVPVIPGILSFRFVANKGAAFSLGEGMGLIFVAFAALVIVAILQYLTRTRKVSKLETLGLGLVAGGALGNAIDRLMLGYVVATDFIDFPVFNVADIGICVGVFFAFVGFMFLSPAAKVDATAELNARDEAAAARREKRRAERVRRARAASNAQGGDTARPEGEDVPADGGDA